MDRAIDLPFEVIRLPRRRLAAGISVIAGGIVLLTVLVLGGIWIYDLEILPFWISYPLLLVVMLGGGLTYTNLGEVGRRLLQRDAVSVLTSDPRPPVLLLRAFVDDDVRDLTNGIRRMEERLCRALHKAGPVIAIGRPNERLPEVGASRLYVADAVWQTAVRHFMGLAGAVVVVVGRSTGIRWEIETAMHSPERTRVLFFFPYMEDRKVRRSFLRTITFRQFLLRRRVIDAMEADRAERYRLFRSLMPTSVDAALHPDLGSSQFLHFLPDGEARLLTTVRPHAVVSLFFGSLTNRYVGIDVADTLRPFLRKLRWLRDGKAQAEGRAQLEHE